MTIKDIARESGYSVGTVSRVLNGSAGVSETAREAVMDIVNKYHFQLNNNAKHLKQQSSQGIAIIIKGTQNMLFAALVEPIQVLIEKRGYASMMFYIDEVDNEVEQAHQICRERRPLVILFLGSNKDYLKKYFHLIPVPCVLVTNSAEGLGIENLSSVSTDDRSGAKSAVDKLIELGHKNIGVLGGHIEMSHTAYCRYMGVKDSFKEHGMTFDDNTQFVTSYFTISGGYQAMEKLLDNMPGITAVFAMADATAIGAIRPIQDRGLRVPEDVSVIGYDGIDIGRYMVPRLTTVRQHREVIATRSVEILLNCIENGAPATHEIEEFHLVTGESVRAR